jgi:hypothetical protein
MKGIAGGIFMYTVLAMPRLAFAYRPFDSTDAAVAAKGEVELELGPLGFLRTGPGSVPGRSWGDSQPRDRA